MLESKQKLYKTNESISENLNMKIIDLLFPQSFSFLNKNDISTNHL
jgi:hypothetical protein